MFTFTNSFSFFSTQWLTKRFTTSNAVNLIVVLSMFLLTTNYSKAESIQRIDFAFEFNGTTGEPSRNQLLELNLRMIDNEIDAFWVLLNESFPNSEGATINVSIKEFDAPRYFEIVRLLRSVRNFDSAKVYRKTSLCNERPVSTVPYEFSVRYRNNNQTIVDLCGSDPAGIPKIDPQMHRAMRLLQKLVREARAVPDSVYTKEVGGLPLPPGS